ncbi:TonB-dependent receptor domain-containing protein [Luteimonas huabeiensis]|uniref:TonB-dependent receptor domain-containing protein n=1 Tax=Luteimonas huabeiensis TaxID=1244513 RepID=UPI0004B09249|nr:TonB-dependent receptor [Luteimonas huabeiensis]
MFPTVPVRAGLAGALSLLCLPAFADTAARDLDTLVVTATATERTLADAPASMSVVTREDLLERPVLDLADALRGTPGVSLDGIGMGRRGIRIRGMDSEYTLVLVDGQRINPASDAIAHADFDLGWIPAEAIERIEVVRGPMSSLYGSEALGGVVNIITRAAGEAWHGGLRHGGGIVTGGRGGGVAQTGVHLAGPLLRDRLGMSFQAEHREKDPTRDPADARLTEQEGRDADTARVALAWTPDDAQRIDVSHLVGRERRERDALQAGRAPYVYRSRDDIDRRQTTVSHRGGWRWGETQVRAYRSTLDRENTRDLGAATGPQSLTDDIVDGLATLGLGQRHRVSAGAEWRRERLQDASVNAAGRDARVQRALFVQDEIDLGALSLVLGNRADHHDTFGWHHSPRAYAVYPFGDGFALKGGLGAGFKAPTLKNLSPGYAAVGGGGMFTIVGNPALKPETVTTYELALAWAHDALSLETTVFQNDLEDLIQTVCTAACGIRGAERRSYVNVAEARLRGAEFGLRAQLPAGFDAELNYTWLDAEDLVAGRPLTGRSRHSGHAGLRWTDEAWNAGLRLDYTGAQWQTGDGGLVRLPGYPLWSLDLGYRIGERIALRGGIENLADKRLDPSSALYPYPETGRYVHARVELGF